jgi:predicted O-methyltransferase YrrM
MGSLRCVDTCHASYWAGVALNLFIDDIRAAFPMMVEQPSPRGWGDPCFQDKELRGALGISAQEGMILHRLVQLAMPAHILEIGSYVGWSAAFCLFETKSFMTCIDSFTEGNGTLETTPNWRVKDRFDENLTHLGVIDRVSLITECSPECLPAVVLPRSRGYGMAFVDGWHFDGQPLRDVQGVVPLIRPTGILVLHDAWMGNVQDAVSWLLQAGWNIHMCPTSNQLAIAWRQVPRWWTRFCQEYSCVS